MQTRLATGNDLPDYGFRDAGDAYRWASAYLERPHMKTFHAIMMGRSAPRGLYAPEDVRDLAETIAACVAMISDARERAAFRELYDISRDTVRRQTLIALLADSLAKHLNARSKRRDQLEGLAEVCILNQWLLARTYGAKKVYLVRYAEAVGVQQPSLYDGGWMRLIQHGNEVFEMWADDGAKVATQLMRERGICG